MSSLKRLFENLPLNSFKNLMKITTMLFPLDCDDFTGNVEPFHTNTLIFSIVF